MANLHSAEAGPFFSVKYRTPKHVVCTTSTSLDWRVTAPLWLAMAPGSNHIQWRRSASHQVIHDLPQIQTDAPQAYEPAPQQTPHPLRQSIRKDVHEQRQAIAIATSLHETLTKHCENLLDELERNTAELTSLRQACQQQEVLIEEQTARADANISSANAWKKKADDLEAAMKRKETEWKKEKEETDQQNQNNINKLNSTHVEEREKLKNAAHIAKTKADQELLKARKVHEDQEAQIARIEASRDHFAAALLVQGVRCAQTKRILLNTAGRLISRTWELGKTRRQLQQSEESAEAERQGYAQASAEYNAEMKVRKQWQKKYDDECVAHRDSINKLHGAQAQMKNDATTFQQKLALYDGVTETLAERTRQRDEKSVKYTALSVELESCKLQLSESKKIQEQESKRANEAEENAMKHFNAKKEVENERDGLKAQLDTIESVFYQRRQDGKVASATKQREDTRPTTNHDAPKAIDKVSDRLTDNEGHDIIRKDSHSPERNAINTPSTTKKRQADGKLPSVPKKRRTYNDSTSREHDIYRPPM